MPSSQLLKLLAHDDKTIRISAVKGLKGRNELNVLQSIYREFQREKDQDVRDVYLETHLVTREGL